jgi:hypothetical protein
VGGWEGRALPLAASLSVGVGREEAEAEEVAAAPEALGSGEAVRGALGVGEAVGGGEEVGDALAVPPLPPPPPPPPLL